MNMRTLCITSLLFLLGACADRAMVFGEGEGDGQSGDPCEFQGDCQSGSECVEGVCVQSGLLRVTLSWDTVTDLDLHVETPGGFHVYYADPELAGLALDVDDCVGGDCRDNTGVHVENIFFDASAARGSYDVWVRNFDGRRASSYRVEVVGDVSMEWTDSLPDVEGVSSQRTAIVW